MISRIRLIDFDGNRDNNFTLIRIFFAWLVLYGHSFAIQKVPGIRDPLNALFQGSIWVGEIAVDGFFAISGFLVAASFVRRGILDYSISRILRIYPALLTCVLVSIFFIGVLFSTLTVVEYLSAKETYNYLNNALAFKKMQWTLPGVFEENIRNSVNGSLWTLTVEVRCYLLLAILGVLGFFRNRVVSNIGIGILLFIGVFYYSEIPLIGSNPRWSRLGLFFLIGACLYINRDKVIMDKKIALAAAVAMFSSFGKDWFDYVFPISFSYLIFYCAYATKQVSSIDRKFGDISYGLYIYAWPIQQAIAHSFPDGNAYTNMALSTLVVSVIAYLSWHFIESPILSKKQQVMEFLSARQRLTAQ